jgi:hypothetical protein
VREETKSLILVLVLQHYACSTSLLCVFFLPPPLLTTLPSLEDVLKKALTEPE